EAEVRLIRVLERSKSGCECTKRLELRRRATDARVRIDMSIRSEDPQTILDDRCSGGEVELLLIDSTTRAARAVGAIPGQWLDKERRCPLRMVRTACGRDVDDAPQSQRSRGVDASRLDLNVVNGIGIQAQVLGSRGERRTHVGAIDLNDVVHR